MNYYMEALKKYAVFSGRAQRAEFWYFVLFNFIVGTVLFLFGRTGSMLNTLFTLSILIPLIAVSVRRLHDTNRSGWWVPLWLIPLIGWIILIVFFATDSDAGENKYGPNPKGITVN